MPFPHDEDVYETVGAVLLFCYLRSTFRHAELNADHEMVRTGVFC